MATASLTGARTLQTMDRIMSASSPTDALESLNVLRTSLQQAHTNVAEGDEQHQESELSLGKSRKSSRKSTKNGPNGQVLEIVSTLSSSREFKHVIATLLAEKRIESMVVEDGDGQACELLLQILESLDLSSSSLTGSSTSTGSTQSAYSSLDDDHDNDEEIDSNETKGVPPSHVALSALKAFLMEPKESSSSSSSDHGALWSHALLDLACPGSSNASSSNNNSSNIYAQTTALLLLTQFTQYHPTLLHSQLSKAPQHLDRILELVTSSTQESLRNQAILFSTVLIQTNASTVQYFIFKDVMPSIFRIALDELEYGNWIVVRDCLELVLEMVCQNDNAADVVWTSSGLMRGLEQFLNLRLLGSWYQNPLLMSGSNSGGGGSSGMNGDMSPGGGIAGRERSSSHHSSQGGGDLAAEDDLDAILSSGQPSREDSFPAVNAATNTNGSTAAAPNGTTLNGTSGSGGGGGNKIPYLTKDEASVAHLALVLLQNLMGNAEEQSTQTAPTPSNLTKLHSRQATFLNNQSLSRLLFDMALYTLPQPNEPYLSGVPPPALQTKALAVMAHVTRHATEATQELILKRDGVLERLMYLICTGGDSGSSSSSSKAQEDRRRRHVLEKSMSSLSVLRFALSAKEASVMVMHTLAPPAEGETLNDNAEQQPPPLPVVQKLMNTLSENLQVIIDHEFAKNVSSQDMERMNMNIIGAAGALGVFLTNGAGETTREMLLRVPMPPPPSAFAPAAEAEESLGLYDKFDKEEDVSLVSCILKYLEIVCSDSPLISFPGRISNNVAASLVRLLIEWVPSNPALISMLFGSPSSIALGVLVQQQKSIATNRIQPKTVPALVGILLGLCMEHFPQGEVYGGWSNLTIMNLINVGVGVGKFTQLLEKLKTDIMRSSNKSNAPLYVGPWTYCEIERFALFQWYTENVNIVRRKVVQELTMDGKDNDESDVDDDEVGVTSVQKKSAKSLGKLVSQQNSELTSLTEKLHKAEQVLTSKSSEIKVLKKRLDSNPTQLDDMLNDYTGKVVEMEKKLLELQDNMNKTTEEHEHFRKDTESQLLQVKVDLEESQNQNRELQSEKESMAEELTGLTSAYTNLEGEYNRVTSSQLNEDATTEGNGVSPSAYNILRNENLKVKGDIRQANDWMKKAVKKIDDLNKRNLQLEGDVNKYKVEVSTVQIDHKNSNTDLIVSKERIQELESEVNNLSQRIESTEMERDVLQGRVDTLQDEIVSVGEAAESQRLNTMQASKQSDNLVAELADEVETLKSQLSEKEDPMTSLNGKTAQSHEIEKLLAENSKLTTAYQEAQKWMTSAVKHHSTLKKQLEEEQRKNSDLTLDMKQLEIHESRTFPTTNGSTNDTRDIEMLKEQLKSSENKIDSLNEQILELLSSREEKNKLEDALKNQEEETQRLQNELDILRSQNEEFCSERNEHNELFIRTQQELESMKTDNASLSSEIEEHITAIEDMKNRLTEFQSWTNTAQQRIAELEADKEASLEKSRTLEESSSFAKNEAQKLSAKLHTLNSENDTRDDKVKEQNALVETLRANIESLGIEMGDLDGRNRALAEDNKVLEKSNATLQLKADLLDENEDNLFNKENQLTEAKKELLDVREQCEIVVKEWRIKCEGLELGMKDLKLEMEEQESIAIGKVSEVESRCTILEADIDNLGQDKMQMEESIQNMNEELIKRQLIISDLKEKIQSGTVTLQSLERANKEYEESLEKHIESYESVIKEHEVANEELQKELEQRDQNTEEQVNLFTKEWIDSRDQSEEVVKKWQENSEQLESTIADLEASLENQRAEANEAIVQWESRCTVLQEQIEQMEDHWNQSEVMRNIETFKDQLLAKEQRCQEGEKKIKELQTTLCAVKDKLIDAQKTQSCLVEAQKNLKDLETDNATLKSTLTNTNETLQVLQHEETQLKQSLHVEKEENSHMKDEVERLKEEMEVILNKIVSQEAASKKAKQMLNEKKSHLQQVEKSLNESQMLLGNTKVELEGVTKEKSEIESTLNSELEKLLQKITYLEHEKVSMLESLNAGNNQSQELNLIIGQLQGELQEANDALQAHITDEVTMRATEMATEALREQVNQLRERQGFDNEALSKERTARISAEEEVDRLKTDLSLLVQVEDSPISADHLEGKVKKMTSKAAANILQRDRADIENLTKNLNKAITELKFCRKSEQDAEERAANARLHTSVCEQELSSAKSDLSILRSTLAETRKEEANIKSTLEKRIHDLERSKEKANDSHSQSISHLKSELSQGQLEREQLMHALNESEKANSTLVYSTTVTTENSGSSMEEIELAKLRLEKAQLLASSAENASKTEKRIREAITGNLSSTEADILEEKEKRKAVENELKNRNEKYDEISSELVNTKAKYSELDAQLKRTNVNELKDELHEIEIQVTSLTKINEDLKIQLITTESEAKTTCTHLTEKCRLAESKVRDLERECRNEAAVAAEVARIRDETKTFENHDNNGHAPVYNNEERKENGVTGVEMHDQILDLKAQIKEEREMYNELLTEHEGLLALLANQELLRTSLETALFHIGGQNAVDRAILEAEEKADDQYKNRSFQESFQEA